MQDINSLLSDCKKQLRLLDDYKVPQDIKLKRLDSFLQQVIDFEYAQINILDRTLQSIFEVLCKDLIKQSESFMTSNERDIGHARNILMLILSIELYLKDINDKPWILGRKASFFEIMRIRRIFRKKLHSAFDDRNKRPVRGTRVMVKLTGSLARGHSDWKLICGGNIPKPTDYNIPREYRKSSRSIYKKLDEDLNLPLQLRPLMSDVDILIVSEILYDSIDPSLCHNGWSFRLGEKYPTGIGASPILENIHQALMNTKIGGIRGRWVNYVVIRDEKGYYKYIDERMKQVNMMENIIRKKVSVIDSLVIDEIIR